MKKKKTKRNPDNLFQRNGIWWLRYNANGKKIRRTLQTRSLKEAKQLRDEFLAQRSARARLGLPVAQKAAPVLTFAQVVEKWREARAADGRLTPGTHRSNKYSISVLLPAFGHMLMSDINVEHIEHFIGDMRKRYTRATLAAHFATFRLIMRQSIRRGWFAGPNPIDRLEHIPSPGPGRTITLTVDEARALLPGLSGRLYYKSALALHTGLRWGEVHGLAWADLSLDTTPPTLTVVRSFRGKPKNEASAETVPISKETVALLRRWKAQLDPDCPWVFPNRFGNILLQRSGPEALAIKAAAARAGIDKCITPHVFRHTFGTWVYERTHDPKMVQRLMRHTDFQTSMRYVHDRRDLSPVVDLLPSLTSRPTLKVV